MYCKLVGSKLCTKIGAVALFRPAALIIATRVSSIRAGITPAIQSALWYDGLASCYGGQFLQVVSGHV